MHDQQKEVIDSVLHLACQRLAGDDPAPYSFPCLLVLHAYMHTPLPFFHVSASKVAVEPQQDDDRSTAVFAGPRFPVLDLLVEVAAKLSKALPHVIQLVSFCFFFQAPLTCRVIMFIFA